MQNAPVFGLQLAEDEKVAVDVADVRSVIKPVDAKAEKERKKKEKAAAAAAAKGTAGGDNTSTEAGGGGGGGGRSMDKATVAGAAAASTVGVADTGAAPAAATAAATNKRKEKKEKAPKPAKAAPPAAAEKKPLTPGLIDLRVGHILKAERHPNADSLYVSRIAVGDAADADNTEDLDGCVVRTVCSGLNGKIPLEEMQGRRVVAVCNLKPVTMRGIKSAAMVLAASEPAKEEGEEGKGGDPHGGGNGRVELVSPPEGAEAGDKVYFDGWQAEPEAILNPKKKVWETCQAGFTTTSDKIVGFDPAKVPQLAGEEGSATMTAAAKGVALLKTRSGTCTVKSLIGAEVR